MVRVGPAELGCTIGRAPAGVAVDLQHRSLCCCPTDSPHPACGVGARRAEPTNGACPADKSHGKRCRLAGRFTPRLNVFPPGGARSGAQPAATQFRVGFAGVGTRPPECAGSLADRRRRPVRAVTVRGQRLCRQHACNAPGTTPISRRHWRPKSRPRSYRPRRNNQSSYSAACAVVRDLLGKQRGTGVDRRRRRLVSLPHQATILAEGDAALTSSYGRDRGNR